MSVIEGHAEHVMDAAAAELGPDLGELRRRLESAASAAAGSRTCSRGCSGMDLKLRQYGLGKAFCDAVVTEAGPEALRAVWRSPEDLPDLDELEAPAALARAGSPSR